MITKRCWRIFHETIDEIPDKQKATVTRHLSSVRPPRTSKWSLEDLATKAGIARALGSHIYDLELNWAILEPLPEADARWQIAVLLAEIYKYGREEGDTPEQLAEAWGFVAPA